MAVSPFALFLRKVANHKQVQGLAFRQRGKVIGQLYKALPADEKAALVKAAKTTPQYKRSKVPTTVLEQAKTRGVPVNLVRKQWYATKGTTTISKLNRIAAKNGIVRKVPKSAAKTKKVASKTKKVAAKKTGKK